MAEAKDIRNWPGAALTDCGRFRPLLVVSLRHDAVHEMLTCDPEPLPCSCAIPMWPTNFDPDGLYYAAHNLPELAACMSASRSAVPSEAYYSSTVLVAATMDRNVTKLTMIPIGRFSQPGDLGHAACYLCSDEASMITAVSMDSDGGRGIQRLLEAK